MPSQGQHSGEAQPSEVYNDLMQLVSLNGNIWLDEICEDKVGEEREEVQDVETILNELQL